MMQPFKKFPWSKRSFDLPEPWFMYSLGDIFETWLWREYSGFPFKRIEVTLVRNPRSRKLFSSVEVWTWVGLVSKESLRVYTPEPNLEDLRTPFSRWSLEEPYRHLEELQRVVLKK